MSDEIIIAELAKNQRETVRVTVKTYNGVLLLNLRVWYRPADGGDLRQGKDGIAFRAEHAAWLRDAINRAAAEIEKQVKPDAA